MPLYSEEAFGRSFNPRRGEDRQEFVKAGAYGPTGCPQVVRKGLAAKIILKLHL